MKMICRYVFLFAICVLSFQQSVISQDTQIDKETMLLATEVVEVTHAAETIKRIVPIVLEQQRRIFMSQNGGNLDDRQRSEINLTLKYLSEELEAIYPAFQADVAALYAQNYSKADLKTILDFYKSDVGVRYSAGSIELGQEIGVLGQRWMSNEALEAAKRARSRALMETASE
jgi:hypothetical protein